jgi:hypothetical protein
MNVEAMERLLEISFGTRCKELRGGLGARL